VVAAARARPAVPPAALRRVSARVSELHASYEAPDFAEVPNPDAALFLCAVDHRSGYRTAHAVGAEGPFEGSELLWRLGLAAERDRPGTLSATALRTIDGPRVAELFRAGDETVAGPDARAELWRDLAAGLDAGYGGSAKALLEACQGRLAGPGGLIDRLSAFVAYADPLAKKGFLFAKIAARRAWLRVADPESWEVCADNVLMRLALRSGLVAAGPVEDVRADTRAAWKAVAVQTGIEPPVLDDLLWEQGRNDADLVGTEAGDIMEPPRPEGTIWY
jgi:hypothetical protein